MNSKRSTSTSCAHHGLPATGLTLAVHDWGGMIGFGWAVRHPERIARLIVTNTAAFPNPKGQRLPAALRLGRDSALGALLIRGFNAFAAGATRHATVRPLAPEVRRAYTAPYDSWAHRIATLRFVQDIPLGPGRRGLGDRRRHRARTAPPRRQADAASPGACAISSSTAPSTTNSLRRFPRAQDHAYDDAGHYVLEDAHERIVPLVRAFLAAPPAT